MTLTFARPNAAFRAYEQSLLRPIARPAPRDAPTLWQRAKEMFTITLEKVSALVGLAQRLSLSRTERRDIVTRLVPVERLTRALLAVEAAVFLLMTPAGMKLRREARIMAMPTRARPQAEPQKRVLYGGWNYQRATFPAVPPAPTQPAPHDPQDLRSPQDGHNPKLWRCAFQVSRWIHPNDDHAKRAKTPGSRPRMISFDELVVRATAPRPKISAPDQRDEPAGAPLARRIEALSRVLENPDRAIRRIARLFASLPREVLADTGAASVYTGRWYHGRLEFLSARALAERAVSALLNARPTESEGLDPEPG